MRKVFTFSLLAIAVVIIMTSFTVADAAENKVLQKKDKELNSKSITFDFPNTELKVFAGFVAKLCRKSLIGEDDLLQQKITIKSQKKMDLRQVKKVFRSVLFSRGLDYRETDVYLEIFSVANSIVKVYKIKYLKSADIAKSLASMFKMSFRVGNKFENTKITSIDTANAVMVLASNNQQLEIEKSIKKLDKRTRQVLLDIMVLEVTRISDFGFGVNYSYSSENAGTGTINPIGSLASETKYPTTFTTSAIPSAGSFGVLDGKFSLNIQAVDRKTKIKVLSQPRITAKENEKASIKIGDKQYYVSGSSSLGGNSGTTQTTGINDLGLDIEITPRINKIKNVIIELKLKSTNILGNYSFANSATSSSDTESGDDSDNNNNITSIPIVGERIIDNTSSVMNGETLVIGGLLKNGKTVIRHMPPFLGDIPWIGWLVSKESEASEQIELMIFITPTIIEDSKGGRIVTKKEADKLSDYDPLEKATVDQMLTGKKIKADNVFNLFDYFKDGKYRKEQNFIPEPEKL